jgi:nicotinamide phosphoribosyltransferase
MIDYTRNPVMWTDYYNLSHWYLKQNQDWEVSHIYNRTREQLTYGFNEQIIDWFANMRVTKEMVEEAIYYAKKMHAEQDFPVDMWMSVVKDFGGKPPLLIEAVPDGTFVPKGTPFAQVRNTVKGFGELVTWWEVVLLKPFFPSGCATRAMWMSQYLNGDNPERSLLPLNRFHSFGFRGYPTMESAYWGGTAWNLFLQGTDDFASSAWTPNAPVGSIPAEAHKVIEQFDNEVDAYKWGIDNAKAHGQSILAIVIDTYDSWRFITNYMVELANYAKERGMHVVFRPDSGDVIGQVHAMWGMKQKYNLDNVSFIIGEGMSFRVAREYDRTLYKAGIPLSSVFYGVGAGFYKDIDRDYLGWSMKTAYSNGANRMKFADSTFKQSIPGIVDLLRDGQNDIYVELRPQTNGVESPSLKGSLFRTVWSYDGHLEITMPQSWNKIYALAHKQVTTQLTIKLSPAVIKEIARIREKYGLTSIQQAPTPIDIKIPENA